MLTKHKYFGLFLSTALCLIGSSVKADERVNINLDSLKFDPESVLISQRQFSTQSLVLNGKTLTPFDVVKVANGAKVVIDKATLERLQKAHELLLIAAQNGQAIYGLTQGVGLNKDSEAS